MNKEELLSEISNTRRYFERTISVFGEEDSNFTPNPEIYTVAQHVAHTGQTCHWMLRGVFNGEWDMDFATHDAEVRKITSLAEAKRLLVEGFDAVLSKVESLTEEELAAIMPADDPIMPGASRASMVIGLADHTAHHRGALTVYARMLSKVPPMPYM